MAEADDEGIYVGLDELIALRTRGRRTSLLPRQPANSLLAGRRTSKLRGRGLDFEELRAYVAGDDVRAIDWRVTARTGRPYVRSYKEERDRPVLLVVDQRPGMFFGSQGAMKSVVAARLAGLLAWRVTAVGDRVGAVIVGATEHWTVRPARSTGNAMRILELLVTAGRALGLPHAPEGAPLDDALTAATHLMPHDGLIVLISDFRGVSPEAVATLSHLRRHNDLLAAWVVDPLEAQLPNVGTAPVTDGRLELSVPTADRRFADAYERAFASDRARVTDFCVRAGAPFFELRTDEPLLAQVERTFGTQRAVVGRRL